MIDITQNGISALYKIVKENPEWEKMFKSTNGIIYDSMFANCIAPFYKYTEDQAAYYIATIK